MLTRIQFSFKEISNIVDNKICPKSFHQYSTETLALCLFRSFLTSLIFPWLLGKTFITFSAYVFVLFAICFVSLYNYNYKKTKAYFFGALPWFMVGYKLNICCSFLASFLFVVVSVCVSFKLCGIVR